MDKVEKIKAEIKRMKSLADKEKENVWKGSIQPLLINNYGDNSKYLLKESGTGRREGSFCDGRVAGTSGTAFSGIF